MWTDIWNKLWKENQWIDRRVAKSPEEPPADRDKAPPKQVRVSVGDATATADIPCCEADDTEGDATSSDGIGAIVLKVAGAAATGITATGFIVAVGAAVFWIRFNEVDLPATQAVGLLAKNELLAQGAQETILYLAISLAIVLLLFIFDPKGRLPRVSLLMLAGLTVAGILYPVCTDLAWGVKLALVPVALVLLGASVIVGLRTGKSFWPLALAVFVATLLYSATVGVLVVKEQRYVQAVAVLRGESDAGLTGVYVTATEETIYLGRVSSIPADKKERERARRAIFDVPREGATYAVGPLETVANAEARARGMLEQLIADRERNPQPPSASAEKPEEATGSEDADAVGTAETNPGSAVGGGEEKPAVAVAAGPSIDDVAKAFGDRIEVHRAVDEEWSCLVRYAASGSRLLGHWWTSCEEDKELAGKSMLDVRDVLALPGRFQPVYDVRIEARLTVGAEITYLEGEVAPQCEHDPPVACGHEYSGGGRQIYLTEVQRIEDPRSQCTETRVDEVPTWKPCSL